MVILLVCAIINRAPVMSQPHKKSSLPSGARASEYESGQVWVKLKRKHRDIFNGHAAGRMAADLKALYIRPFVNPLSVGRNSSRVAPRKPHIDISLYSRIIFDPSKPTQEFIDELYRTGYFEKVEPVPVITPFFTPNDPSIIQQYYLDLINAQEAWNISQGDQSLVIGIVDTGGDLDHPDLQANVYIDPADPTDGVDNDNDGYIDNNRGWDFSGADIALIGTPGFIGDNDPSITKGGLTAHGTMVAGCASAATNNGVGISGVGFNTKLLFTKHYADNQPGTSYSSNLYDGVLYAATHGAKIINCSWGGYNPNTIAQDIITYVTLDLGCLVVAAAGNSNLETPIYPAAYDYVLSVASSDQNDVRSPFSNFGKTIDIIAPGNGIYTTSYNDAYNSDSGTSLAAPIVSGAAALIWANNPLFSPLQVAEQLRVSADESIYAKNPLYLNKLGRGRLDVFRALTMTSPSIRASNQLLIKEDGSYPSPGDNARLYFDFKNYLQPSSPSLKVTLSSSSPYLSIVVNEIILGSIPENATVRNSAMPFEVIISAALPIDQPVEALLTFKDGVYEDFQLISFSIPSYIDVNENNIITSVTASGRIGFGNTEQQTNGSGFIYDEERLLYEMGLIMGSSSTNISNNVRSISNTYDQDFTATYKLIKLTPGERSYSEIEGSLRNSPQLSTASLAINYRSLVWKNDPYRNFVILEYKVKNVTNAVISDFHFGVFADWDIASNGGEDRALWDNDTKLGYVLPVSSSSLPQAGIQALGQSVHYYAIDNDQTIAGNPFGIYDGYTDNEKFLSISSGLTKTTAGMLSTGNDVSHVVAQGPYTINPGEEITLAFALHAARTTPELITSAKYADTVYNYTLKAPVPNVDPKVWTCEGSSATIEASGATKFKWYKDFTGGSAIFAGSQFITGNLHSDTVFYVSNADESYESLRTPVEVIVLQNPVVTPSGDLQICQGETVQLSADDADEYTWSNGAKTKSILVDQGGQFSVVTKRENVECSSEDMATVTVKPKPSAAFTVTPGSPAGTFSFTATGTDGVSWLWDFGDGTTSSIQSPVHTFPAVRNYDIVLTVTSVDGCIASEQTTIGITGVEPGLTGDFSVYPNPLTTEKVILNLSRPIGNGQVSIFDTRGVMIRDYPISEDQQSLDLSGLSNGIYVLRISNSSSSVTVKLVLSR